MPTARSLEFKQVSLAQPLVNDGDGIKGRDKDEKVSPREQAAFCGSVDGGNVVTFVDGKAEVSEEVAAELVRQYPKSVFIEDSKPAKG